MSSERRMLGPLNLPKRERDILTSYNKILQDMYLMLQEYQASFYVVQNSAPEKPREGMIRFADGTNWNPGSGRGLYQYVSTAWVKL